MRPSPAPGASRSTTADPSPATPPRPLASIPSRGGAWATRAASGTSVLFRHYRFGAGYGETDLGHTAQTWALILDRLQKYVASGIAQPFFPAPST